MFIKQIVTALIGVFAAASSGWAACSYPSGEVSIPDGASATEEQMAEARAQVRSRVDALNAYLACLEEEAEANRAAAAEAGEELSAEQDELFVKRYNAAVDAMHAVAEAFNVEIRKYKDRTEP